jgi:MerR family mercuric resistance operon transcriptional regulator
MDTAPRTLTIGALAAAAGVNVETVRYYQRRGLLNEPRKPGRGIRHYGDADMERLCFVKAAQTLGFSLDEVAELLTLADGTHCREARELAQHKLKDVRGKLASLRHIEAALAGLVRDCARARGTLSCPLITALLQR